MTSTHDLAKSNYHWDECHLSDDGSVTAKPSFSDRA